MSRNLIKHFILVNPNEICEFIKIHDLYEFLMEVSSLVNEFFPNAKIYLEFHEDSEIQDLNSLFGFIYDDSNSHLDNEKTFSRFLRQYHQLEDEFKEHKKFFVIDLIEDNVEYK